MKQASRTGPAGGPRIPFVARVGPSKSWTKQLARTSSHHRLNLHANVGSQGARHTPPNLAEDA